MQEEFTFVPNAGGDYVLTLASPPLQVYTSVIDNARLEAVPEPGLMTLVAGGGLLAAIFRRGVGRVGGANNVTSNQDNTD